MNYPNNWIPTKTLEQMKDTVYDVLIVGSGAGGGAILYRLCEFWKGQGAKRIGILEKGDKLFHSHAFNIPTSNEERMFRQLFPDNSTPVGNRLPEYPAVRLVFALGGRTLFWSGTSLRPPMYEQRKWPIHPMELNAYFNIAEDIMNVTKFYADGSSMQNLLMKRLQGNGFLNATDIPLAIDMRSSFQGQIHSNPWFCSLYFLAYALNKRPFDLALHAFVSRVMIENGRATGVEVFSSDKKAHILRAKSVVISASALETPRILLNSGIKRHAIGRYLTGNLFILSGGKIDRKQFNENLGNLSILVPETEHEPYNIQISGPNPYFAYQQFQEKLHAEELDITVTAFGKVESRPENRVYLDESVRDEYGVPMIQVDYSYSATDQITANKMRQGITQTISAMGVKMDEAPLSLRPPGSDMHESCTCRMGRDPETSATDQNAQVHGIPGLYIADNSVLPTLAAANPTLSTVAIAFRLADHIVRQSS